MSDLRLASLEGQLVVSCQAYPGEPMPSKPARTPSPSGPPSPIPPASPEPSQNN
jgi:hypothetical protein